MGLIVDIGSPDYVGVGTYGISGTVLAVNHIKRSSDGKGQDVGPFFIGAASFLLVCFIWLG